MADSPTRAAVRAALDRVRHVERCADHPDDPCPWCLVTALAAAALAETEAEEAKHAATRAMDAAATVAAKSGVSDDDAAARDARNAAWDAQARAQHARRAAAGSGA